MNWINSDKKVTGSGSGTARAMQPIVTPPILARRDVERRPKKSKKVQKSPKSKVTGTGSGTAGDAQAKPAPPLKYLAYGADSAVRVLNTPNILANFAQQLPP